MQARTAAFSLMLATGLAASAAVLLPVFYLGIRVLGIGPGAWESLLSPGILKILWNSLVLMTTVTAGAVALGVPLAWLLARTDLPGRRFWTVLCCLPLVIPSFIAGFVWVSTLGPHGLIHSLFSRITGLQWFPDIYGFPGAWLLLTILTYPFVLLTVRGSFQRLDPALEEASRSLGIGPWPTFFRITLPQLFPAVGAGGLLVALYTLSDFGAVSLLRYQSFTWAIYLEYQTSLDRHLAALLSLTLVALTLPVFLGETLLKRRASFLWRSRPARAPKAVRLGVWRWPVTAVLSGLVTVGVLLPVGVIGYWLVGLPGQGLPGNLWQASWNSLQVSAAAALASALVALPVAVLAVRHRRSLGGLLERTVYLGYGLPGIVIALSLVFFLANYAPFLYQSLPLLIFAYLIRYLSHSVGATAASLRQVNPRLEEAAAGLGATRRRVFYSITVPLVRPGILAGVALVFLTTIKELPITLLMAPTGFETLATQIWSATSEAFFARAAVPSLLLLALSAFSLSFILGREPEQSL